MSKRKVILGVVIILVLAVATLAASKVAGKKEVTYTVEAVDVKPQLFLATVSASGTVDPLDSREIRATVTGRIASVLIKQGDAIASGALIATMDETDLRNQVQQAKAAMTSAEAVLAQLRRSAQRGAVADDLDVRKAESRLRQAQIDLEQARTNAGRFERLFAGGAVPRRQLEEARATVDKAEALVEESELLREQARDAAKAKAEDLVAAEARVVQARSALRAAEKQLAEARFVSPFAGTVVEKFAEDGAYVTPGAILAKVADVRRVIIKAKVDEADIGRVSPGQEVEITTDAMVGRKLAGSVARIAPQAVVENNAVKFEMEIDVQNDEGLLKPGMSADVEVVAYRKPNAIVVPIQAVVERAEGPEAAETAKRANKKAATGKVAKPGAQKAAPVNAGPQAEAKQVKVVYVVRDGRAVRVPVQVGESSFADIEIVKGLKAGETVVTGDYQVLNKLRDGHKVKVADPDKDKGVAKQPTGR